MLLAQVTDSLPRDNLPSTVVVEVGVEQPFRGSAKTAIDQRLSRSRVSLGFNDQSDGLWISVAH
jgi:hypothetical protein